MVNSASPRTPPQIPTCRTKHAKQPTLQNRLQLLRCTQPAIYAVSIAKYAFKRGRLTIPPTTFLQACDLLPALPTESSGNVPDSPQPLTDTPLSSSADLNTGESHLRKVTSSQKSGVGSDAGRDDLWHTLEARRLKHLGLAKHVAGLDAGLSLFTIDEEVAFARY